MSIQHISEAEFETEVETAQETVLLDFFADWCGPCRMLAPVLEAFAEAHPEVKVCKINVDEEAQLAAMHGIVSIPTLIVYRNGAETARTVGLSTKEEIEALIAQ